MLASPTGFVLASLAAFCIETLLYGCFLVLFAFSLCLMFLDVTPSARGERHPYPKPMVWFSILIFFLVTAHWALSAVQAFQGFVLHLNGRAAAEFFADLSQPSSVSRECVMMVLFIISDLTIIYRLWSVWDHNGRVVIVPGILIMVSCTFAVIIVYTFISNTNIIQNPTMGLGTTTLSINVYCAGMIVWKLLRASKVTRNWENVSRFKFTIIILVESLALYVIWGMLFGILHLLGSPVSIVFGGTQSPITGIAFIILHVRVGIRRLGRDAVMLIDRHPSQAEEHGEA
ncbi:hypothetical protein BD779DRAFT_513029 [Infundibulicybe gibba]|nr:hypothetical protein BD779DRAFT_513029 [Infundibulicybe gibba]